VSIADRRLVAGSPSDDPSGSASGSAYRFDAPSVPYGLGCPGAGGFRASLRMIGDPTPGQAVTLSLEGGFGGAASLTMISAASASLPVGGGCTLLVSTPAPALSILLGGSGPGNGTYLLPGTIPASAPQIPVYFQAFIADGASSTGFSASHGLRVDIG